MYLYVVKCFVIMYVYVCMYARSYFYKIKKQLAEKKTNITIRFYKNDKSKEEAKTNFFIIDTKHAYKHTYMHTKTSGCLRDNFCEHHQGQWRPPSLDIHACSHVYIDTGNVCTCVCVRGRCTRFRHA